MVERLLELHLRLLRIGGTGATTTMTAVIATNPPTEHARAIRGRAFLLAPRFEVQVQEHQLEAGVGRLLCRPTSSHQNIDKP